MRIANFVLLSALLVAPPASANTNPAGSAPALSPSSISFLREMGLDPSSPDVLAASRDDINGVSLESLAADRSRKEVTKFLATRAFIRAFEKDSRAFRAKPTYPPNYDGEYLSLNEQTTVGKAVADYYLRGSRLA